MERPAPTFESPTTRTWVLRSGAETDGKLYEQRVEYAPGSPFPPSHFHPQQSERFEVERGAMIYVVDGREHRVGAGETLELAPGQIHKARNASSTEPAVIRWETRPALRSAEFFAMAAGLGDAGALDQALLAHEYRDVFKVTGVLGMALPVVAAIARLVGRGSPQVKGS